MSQTEILARLAVALGIGLLVGLERGWRTREEEDHHRVAGLRTFALAGLTGGVAGALSVSAGPLVLGFVFLGFAGAFTAFHWLEAKAEGKFSATSLIAALLTFVLGAYAVTGEVQIAAAGGVATTILLALREQLHGWVRGLTWPEIKAVLVLLAMSCVLLPVLPDRAVDPWQTLNPWQLWLFAILIAGISFGGYVAIRLFGDRLGVILASVAGGLSSSTATTMALARMAGAHPQSWSILVAGMLSAGAVMVLRVGLIAALLNPALLASLLSPVLAAAAVQAIGAAVLALRRADHEAPKLELANPLELGSALKLAAFMAVVLVVGKLLQQAYGGAGVMMLAAVSGLADVDAVTVSIARMSLADLGTGSAALAIGLAVAVNALAKVGMAAYAGGWRCAFPFGAISLLAIMAGGAVGYLASTR
ncbi:DUF4010 domain-containing protein [Labrys sp. LIt4]|uniref:Uncharacterized protein n=1 Tax=Labrys okinawensis TaxID=346911 RepID=A0A2S9QJM8_9HYPH|nr:MULTISPECIES: MgtC/SapB family protein [Labrys]MBP0580419.1 DUF4010 domain-containing protein [Labrys sp. LIt4]PRH89553.1 hypothetical protein C5L14_03045 [Labrys okinawensis]